MNGRERIRKSFEKPGKLLSIYLTAGYPRLSDTLALARGAVAGGAGMLEIGFPFSDPIADGPVIQQSNMAAIRNGMSLKRLIGELPEIRRAVDVPLILMGAMNPILRYGAERFFSDAARSGADGLIVPDLPFDEYLRSFKKQCDSCALAFVPLFTARTPEERLRRIDRESDGFLYLVSSEGTTGGRFGLDCGREASFKRIAALGLRNPIMVGFGISDAASFSEACRYSRGGIVGSAFVRAVSDSADPGAAALAFVKGLNGDSKAKE